MTTPRASSTSAEPDADDAARLPCLHTGTPAPATTKAAMVDTFTLWLRSPPVPHVSMASGPASTRSAKSSMVRTRPVISSMVSPLVRRAMAKPAIWAGVALPSRMSLKAAPACSVVRPEGAVANASTPGQPPSASMFISLLPRRHPWLLGRVRPVPLRGPHPSACTQRFLGAGGHPALRSAHWSATYPVDAKRAPVLGARL